MSYKLQMDKYVRNLEVVYKEIPLGIWIQDVNGDLFSSSNWDNEKVANGIAVATEECQFVMALDVIERDDKTWYGMSRNDFVEGCSITNSNIDELYYTGQSDTYAIIQQAGDTSEATAAGACKSYIFPNGQNGYLGSNGEWKAVLDNIDIINECLLKTVGKKLILEAWTSTQYNDKEIIAVIIYSDEQVISFMTEERASELDTLAFTTLQL